jgi:hypothetical protein
MVLVSRLAGSPSSATGNAFIKGVWYFYFHYESKSPAAGLQGGFG